jgi:hypothetical protein
MRAMLVVLLSLSGGCERDNGAYCDDTRPCASGTCDTVANHCVGTEQNDLSGPDLGMNDLANADLTPSCAQCGGSTPLCMNGVCVACDSIVDGESACAALDVTAPHCLTTGASKGACVNCRSAADCSDPAKRVCDPATNSYGPETWDLPCTTLKAGQSITVNATYGFTSHGLSIDFSPAMRFNPSTEVRISTGVYAPVLTTFASYFAAYPSTLHFLGIYYAPGLDLAGKTDAAFDPSLITHVNLSTGLVWRRIKHFSGYNIASGLPCDPSPDDPDCVDGGGPLIER